MNHLVFLLPILAALALGGCSAVRAGYESAPYRAVETRGGFEIRDYPRLALAETPMGDGANGGFGRLFRYISGDNAGRTHISMTTPVLMEGGRMAFVMPQGRPADALPKPDDTAVSVSTMPAGRFAVLRFSGGRSPENEAAAARRLSDLMKDAGMTAGAAPVFCYFDPPWTPPFLRRNEVMIRVGGKTP